MLRIAMMVLRLFLKAPYYLFKISYYGKTDRYTEEERFALAKYVTIKANRAGKVKIESYGLENIPEENGFVFFPNHQGLYDTLAFLESSPRPFAVVMKKEASNVILLKQALRLVRGQVIDREDLRQSMRVIQTMTEEIKQGRNYLIFAEGTRGREGNKVFDMKPGSFKSAMNARCPIIPVALIDSFVPFDINSIRPVTVQIHYLKPICYEEYKGLKTVDVAKIVKQRVEDEIKVFDKTQSL